MFIIKLTYKLFRDKDFTGLHLRQFPGGVISNQISFSYQLMLALF
jgi:hypothetical protein